jgi:Spy/CpxP family protein refolding chaperone
MKNWIKPSLIFVVGLLLGSIATVLYINHCMNRLWMNSGDHRHILDRLSCELKLTADQKLKVEAILKAEDPEVDKLRCQGRDAFRAIRDKIDSQIRPLLTPDQLIKLDALKAQREHPPAPAGFFGSFWFLFHPMPLPDAGGPPTPVSPSK